MGILLHFPAGKRRDVTCRIRQIVPVFLMNLVYSNKTERRDGVQTRTRTGLIVGVVGLVPNICVSGFIGFCGPFLPLIAGDQPIVPPPSQDIMS